MAFIKGYKYTTEQDAINAREACDAYYSIPVTTEDVTQNWCDYQKGTFEGTEFWYILYDESLLPILGEPIEFEINNEQE